jgi:hypothetical protein
MAPEKQQSSGTTVVNQTTTPTMTPMEQELLARNNRIDAASEADRIAMNKNAAANVNTLLTGGQLPGNLGQLSGGLSQAWQNNAANAAVNQTRAGLNSSGLLDSGAGAVAQARTAGDIYNQAGQFNIQTLQQLLNQALGGQASVTGTMQTTSGQLASSLAGLRTINSNSNTNSNQTITSMNPFLKSFQTSLGSSLGSGFGGGFSKMSFGG